MSSGFVSGGTTEQPIERDDAWLIAQQEIEAARRQKEELANRQNDKSLYEILQNNKAAKEDAFQESIKLKNQFRNLDDDEVEFLDSVLESTRAKEAAVKKETGEQLEAFRKQQEESDKILQGDQMDKSSSELISNTELDTTSANWAVGAKKRKRGPQKQAQAFQNSVKLRRASSSVADRHEEASDAVSTTVQGTTKSGTSPPLNELELSASVGRHDSQSAGKQATKPVKVGEPAASASLGLVSYSSDEDD